MGNRDMNLEKQNNQAVDQKVILLIMTGLLLFVAALALLFGGVKLSAKEVLAGLMGSGSDKINVIIRELRLPRVAGAFLAGAGLSVSGVLLQGVTDNGLASPNIIGVNSGAGLMTILMISFFPEAVHILPFGAFLGAFAATLLIIYVSGCIGVSKTTVVLAGMALTTILNAGISFVSLLDSEVVAVYNYFSVGGLSGVTKEGLIVPAILIFAALLISLWLSPKIALLCLGDNLAVSLGVNVKALRIVCLICASASAASVVSFAGLLGFAGLIVPHIARRLSGGHMKHTFLMAALTGGILVITADMLGRTLVAPTEIPVGIIMALIGAPFFLWLLLGKKKSL